MTSDRSTHVHDHRVPARAATSARESAAAALDPVCGMTVDTRSAPSHVRHGTTYFFCSEGCRKKFVANPEKYASAGGPETAGSRAAAENSRAQTATATRVRKTPPSPGRAAGTIWTCPMHPEIRRDAPGSCPICGMALEPLTPIDEGGESADLRDMTRRFWLGVVLTAPLLWAMLGEVVPAIDPMRLVRHTTVAWAQLVLATLVLFGCGWPLLVRGWQSVVNRSLNMFTLIALGTVAAWAFSVLATVAPGTLPASFRDADGVAPLYFEAAAVIVTLVLLGQVLELRARAQTSGAIRALLKLAPKIAHRVDSDGKESDVALDVVGIGDTLRVRPGENVPVDGVVLEGSSHVDESMLTGEPDPVRKIKGSPLTAGTTNGTGALLMHAEHVGGETLLAQIVHLVAQAQRSRAPVQRLADEVSAWFVPGVVVIALLAAAAWGLFGPEPRLAHALVAAVSVLIIACPCALGLATPMSIMVGVGRGALEGVLIKDAAALEKLERVTTLVVDKTGTLTEGKPSLERAIAAAGFDEAEVLRIAASVEAASEHPLARAIVDGAKAQKIEVRPAENFESDPGLGVWGTVDGRHAAVGNVRLMQREGVDVGALEKAADEARGRGATAIHVATDGRPAGLLVIADAIKATTPAAIDTLKHERVRVIMLTGDDERTARAVGAALGVDEVVANVLPQDKAAVVQRLQKDGRIVAMAGDGVNDAPALAQADVGIAMGTGTDIAMESAGVTLVKGDLRGIARAIRLSRLTMRNIRQNLLFAFGYNALGVPIAAGVLYPALGVLLSPALASLAMSLSSVSVIGNALRLRRARLV